MHTTGRNILADVRFDIAVSLNDVEKSENPHASAPNGRAKMKSQRALSYCVAVTFGRMSLYYYILGPLSMNLFTKSQITFSETLIHV